MNAILKDGNIFGGNHMIKSSRFFTCKCGSKFPVRKLEEHVKKDHFDSDGGIGILMTCI